MLPSPLRKAVALTNPVNRCGDSHPQYGVRFFAPFSRGGRGSFGNIRWKNLFTLEPFVDGPEVYHHELRKVMPLLVEQLDQGSVLLFTGTLDMAWGKFSFAGRVCDSTVGH